jgi:hypothetical protein
MGNPKHAARTDRTELDTLSNAESVRQKAGCVSFRGFRKAGPHTEHLAELRSAGRARAPVPTRFVPLPAIAAPKQKPRACARGFGSSQKLVARSCL